jgi:UDP-N-acetylglucosamine 1-carboxyvinyltransferase
MVKDKFLINGLGGEKKLEGSIAVAGAKNAVLPAMAASVLFKDTVSISNVPDIADVKQMEELLERLGAKIKQGSEKNLNIDASEVRKTAIDNDISKHMRASIILTGPILARFGEVSFCHPGGCVIGMRPIDMFLNGFTRMGGLVEIDDDNYKISVKGHNLKGANIFFKHVSVTATETLMLAAVLAEGKTVLMNAAMEPEIESIADFLNSCGAKIEGAGTPTIEIEGGDRLLSRGKIYETLPDRIEAGSFLILGALAAQNLEITNCIPEHIEVLTAELKESGVPISIDRNNISIKGNEKIKNSVLKSVNVRTSPYPGFATDLQAPMTIYLTQVSGESRVFETIFDGRLNYTEDLKRMGADITMWNPHQITVKGPEILKGRELEGPDLRAGLAYVIAAIVAKGSSTIHNVHYIDRGYERIEERLKGIGVDIIRIQE